MHPNNCIRYTQTNTRFFDKFMIIMHRDALKTQLKCVSSSCENIT